MDIALFVPCYIDQFYPQVALATLELGRVLARSATGQPVTTYSSYFVRPKPGGQIHIVLVDNGRSDQLGRPHFRNSLKCIRCGACFNTCPVYRRSGGHSYHNAVGGPIGSILAPNLDKRKNTDLPFASTLCGSCSNVCPVKIDIHTQLWRWRQLLMREGYAPVSKTIAMKLLAWGLGNPTMFRFSGCLGRYVLRQFPKLVSNSLNPWYRQREMPSPPPQSFQQSIKRVNPMSSREHILAAVARNQPVVEPLPELPTFPYLNGLRDRFTRQVKAIGGTVVYAQSLADVDQLLTTMFKPSGSWITDKPSIKSCLYFPDPVTRGQEFNQVDRAVLTGDLGVAENGAVGSSNVRLPHRVLPLLCQHLVLVVTAGVLAGTMHRAYQQLEEQDFAYDVFIAGSSKTEIAGHWCAGPRSLTFILISA